MRTLQELTLTKKSKVHNVRACVMHFLGCCSWLGVLPPGYIITYVAIVNITRWIVNAARAHTDTSNLCYDRCEQPCRCGNEIAPPEPIFACRRWILQMSKTIWRAPDSTTVKTRQGCRLRFVGFAYFLIYMMSKELIGLLEFNQREDNWE